MASVRCEIETELVAHLIPPLDLQVRRTHDQRRANAMSQDQLLANQTALDRFPKPYIVGDQKVDARHLDRPDQRVKLVILDFDAGAKRRLKRTHVRLRGGTPTHRVQKGVETDGIVEPFAGRG